MLCTEQSHCHGPLALGVRSPASENTFPLVSFLFVYLFGVFLSEQTKYGYGKRGRLSAHFGRKELCISRYIPVPSHPSATHPSCLEGLSMPTQAHHPFCLCRNIHGYQHRRHLWGQVTMTRLLLGSCSLISTIKFPGRSYSFQLDISTTKQ